MSNTRTSGQNLGKHRWAASEARLIDFGWSGTGDPSGDEQRATMRLAYKSIAPRRPLPALRAAHRKRVGSLVDGDFSKVVLVRSRKRNGWLNEARGANRERSVIKVKQSSKLQEVTGVRTPELVRGTNAGNREGGRTPETVRGTNDAALFEWLALPTIEAEQSLSGRQ
jgi:hypothetical protein